MKIELDGGPVKRLVNVWRDSLPLPGEPSPRRIEADSYSFGLNGVPPTVASIKTGNAPRWSQFLVNEGPHGDALLALLKQGPVTPEIIGDALRVDLDRPKRG